MPIQDFASKILLWYDIHRRDLPWRTEPPNPYKVWISEIMLQQTTVATVVPYFLKFIHRFPSLEVLASAPLDDVLLLWQGLGYYRRAIFLHKCAQQIVQYGMPQTEEGWRQLPGIGFYTAAAISAIALGHRAIAIDGNIERIISRYAGLNGSQWKIQLKKKAEEFCPPIRCGDYTQGLMDLASKICRPRNPLCHECPLSPSCHVGQSGQAESFPPKVQRLRKKRFGHAFVLFNPKGQVLLSRCPPHTLLQGLWGFPTTVWESQAFPVPTGPWQHQGQIQHIFTHFELSLDIWTGQWNAECGIPGEEWASPTHLGHYPFSQLMRKIQQLILETWTQLPSRKK